MDLHMHDQDKAGPYAAAAAAAAATAGGGKASGCAVMPGPALREPGPATSQDHHQQQQQADEQPAPPQLTLTVSDGLQDIETHRQQLHGMIDELAQVGLSFLDSQRQRFTEVLDSFKEEVNKFCEEEAGKGHQVSFDTLAAQERLSRAQQLVQCLGGAVGQPR